LAQFGAALGAAPSAPAGQHAFARVAALPSLALLHLLLLRVVLVLLRGLPVFFCLLLLQLLMFLRLPVS
jgi:hypothetical protein